MKEESWTLEVALPFVRRIAAIGQEHGFTLALYGSVLMQSRSANDLDLYLIVAEEKTTTEHARTCVHALAKMLPNAECKQITPDCARIQFKDGKRIDLQFLEVTPLS